MAKYLVERLRLPPKPIHRSMWEYGSTTTLQLKVFRPTQRNFVADFIRLNLNFITAVILFIKMTNSLFKPPFGGVSGEVRTSSISRRTSISVSRGKNDCNFYIVLTGCN